LEEIMAVTTSRRARWTRHFVVLCALLAPLTVTAEQPVKVQATQRAFNEAYRQQDWSRAIELGLELARMVPDRPLVQYNLACVYALGGQSEEAVHWLGRSAASGFHNLGNLDADSDLDGIRDRPGFAGVRAAVAENQRRSEAGIRRAVVAAPPILVPPKGIDPDRPTPLIIAFHGYGDRPDNYPRAWGGAAAKRGAILAVPQGVRRVGNGYFWGNVEEADAILQLTLEQVKERFAVDEGQIVLTGFSQGGFMAMALGLRHPELFVGVIPIAGGYIPEIDAPTEAAIIKPRYYFIVGEDDEAAREVRLAVKDFKAAGYDVKLRILHDTGHTFPRETNRELGRALDYVLGR